MAKLFKNKLLKEKLNTFDVPDLEEKINVLAKWANALQDNSLNSKTESQCEQAFNQDIFIDILGYSKFPNIPYTLEPKASTETSGQKPDAALGFFEGENHRVQVVCEIKDSKTSLDKSQKREGNLSPVQQAFKYKPQYKDCRFVIATNFNEIRLYRDNQLDFESFNLLSLVSEKNNYFEFKKFYFLLCADNMLSKRGESKTEKLLSEIRIEQEHITKDFYKEYKTLRYQLIDNIIKNNPNQSISLVIEKAQKLIDRIVFVCFCEDINLLPENKLVEVIEYAKKGALDQPVWDVMKLFFVAIDKGSEKLGIPDGYNGELFKPDSKLDALLVDDDICEQFVKLGRYDFSEDLSVNILGHIFEQSISDLENLRAEYEGEKIQKKDSKRKKDGIYYTPDYIVDYIVNQAVGGYLKDQESAILEKHGLKEGITQENYDKRNIKAYKEYQTVLRNVKVLDPACGSGAFLVKVFDYLFAENKRVSEILTQSQSGRISYVDTESYTKDILQNNIYGVDINAESVEITKLSLWLKTAQKGKKLATLKDNIKCGNSLIDDPEVAGDKAFKWEDEFKTIMDAGGFDVVVGNPPYVQLSNTIFFTKELKNYFIKKHKTSAGRLNTYVYFFHLALQVIKTKGKLGYIVPNTILTQDYYEKTREFIFNIATIEKIITYPKLEFPDAIVETTTIIIHKQVNSSKYLKVYLHSNQNLIKKNKIECSTISYKNQYKININQDEICRKISSLDSVKLGTLVNINQGIALKEDKNLSISKENRPGLYKLIDGKHIGKYYTSWSGDYLEFDIDKIHSCKRKDIFLKPEKLLFRRVSEKLVFTYDCEKLFTLNTLVVLTLKQDKVSLKYLLCILNSKLINYFYTRTYKSPKKVYSEIQARSMGQVPISIMESSNLKTKLENLSSSMLNLNKSLIVKTNHFKSYLQSTYTIEKLPKSFDKFYALDFSDIQKALKKLKASLTKKDEFELMELFEDQKKQALELKAQIDQTDREIDQMVYELYGLTEEEIRIVEEATQ